MIKGIEYKFGDEIYIIPPLNLGAIEILEDDLANFTEMTVAQQAKIAISLIYFALKRNYPEITREKVADLIDIQNMHEIMPAICDLSGLVGASGNGESNGGK